MEMQRPKTSPNESPQSIATFPSRGPITEATSPLSNNNIKRGLSSDIQTVRDTMQTQKDDGSLAKEENKELAHTGEEDEDE